MSRRLVATNSALALAGELASKLGLLLVMVVAARTLPTGELAAAGVALAAAGIAAVVLDAGAGILVTRDGAADRATGTGLFAALLRARLPVAAGVVGVAALAGAAAGRPLLWTSAALMAVLGAVAMSLVGLFRAGQDMRPEVGQKLLFATLALAASGATLASPTAETLTAGLTVATGLSVAFLSIRARGLLAGRRHARAISALRRAVPLGLLAIATVVYYRAGTVALAALSTPEETARYTIASTVGFGLLLLPNAITTGLLPHLSAHRHGASAGTTRWALGWSLALSAPVAAGAALAGTLLLGPVFGSGYGAAAAPLAILCASVCLIACSGVLGTALIAAGHVRAVAVQVGVSLAVNAVALAVLVPPYGAVGAATATLVCEAVAVVALALASLQRLPGLLIPRPPVPTTR